jgi:Histidyl-tRNA synthetase
MAKQKTEKKEKKATPLQSVKGMHDILPQDSPYWEKIHKSFKEIVEYYNFVPIFTPVVESLDLYTHTTGEASDIVEKQMFLVKGKGANWRFGPSLPLGFLEHI